MKKKLFAVLLSAAMLATGLAGCGGGGDDSTGGVTYDDGFGENVLRITYDHESESGDPRQTTSDYLIAMNVFDTLFFTESTADGGSELNPGLAESYEISEDGKTYSFKLREGVKYTNGEELTSDDVLYTVDSMLDPERSTLNSTWMDMVAGAQEVLAGTATTVEGKGVIIHDDYNFDIVLNESYAPFLATLTTPAWSILNREACDAADEAGGGKTGTFFGTNPEYTVGSGPFTLKEWILNDHIYLEANKDYWRGAPKIDGILIKVVTDPETEKMMFDQGQTDIFDLDNAPHLIPEYTGSDQWKDCIVPKLTFGVTFIVLNENMEPLNNAKVRQALQMAVDRQTIIDTLYQGAGVPAKGIYPETMLCGSQNCFNKDLPEMKYDPEGAKALLAEAGYADGFDMTISMTTSESKSSKDLVQVLQDQFAQIGVNVTIDQIDRATYYDIRANGELPSHVATWWGDFNDPDNFVYTFFSTEATVARSFNYQNKEAIARVEAARHIVDEAARTQEYIDLEKIIIQDDAAWVPLFTSEKIRVVQPRVKGFIPQWAGWGDCSYYSVELTPAE